MTKDQAANIKKLLNHSVVGILAITFEVAGKRLFLVGGCVRDALDGHPSFDDLDFTTDATPDEVESIVSRIANHGEIWTAGKRFGTIGVTIGGQKVEITTFRGEEYQEGSRKPRVVFVNDLKEDLRRRDFTINAMAIEVTGTDHKVIDPFGGTVDLANRTLRTPVSPFVTFSEDPLRIIRAIRFAVTRDFLIGDVEQDAIYELGHRLSTVSTERKTEEFRKIMKAGGLAVRDAWFESARFDIDEHLFGKLGFDARKGLQFIEVFKAHPDLTGVEFMAKLVVMTPGGEGKLRDLTLSNAEVEEIVTIARAAKDAHEVFSEFGARTYVRRYDDEDIDRGIRILSTEPEALASIRACQADPRVRAKLPVDGNDVLAETDAKGPEIGFLLRQVEQAFLDNLDLTRDEAIHIIKTGPRSRRRV